MRRKSGSITVEAALILPIFLSAMISIIMLINVVYVHEAVYLALQNSCRRITACAYAVTEAKNYSADRIENELVKELIDSGEDIMTGVFAQTLVINELKRDRFVKDLVLDNGDINLGNSTFMKDAPVVDLIAEYSIELPFLEFAGSKLNYKQRVRMHSWTGYEKEESGESDNGEQLVYITESGVVYHLSKYCTYINPKVNSVSGSALSSERSASGSIYYPCEFCKPQGKASPGDSYYVTKYGNRYHSLSSCTAIKHEVTAIDISEVGARRECSKCGN